MTSTDLDRLETSDPGEGAMRVERFRLPAAAIRLTIVAASVAVFAFFAIAAHAAAAGCFATPSACGYPDATNTGVPAGTALTTVSSVTLGAGQTLEGKIVTNGVRVTGANATIRNSVIKTPSGGNGTTAIEMGNGANNFTIEHSEVTGNGSKTNAPESNVWNHYEDSGFRVIDSYLHGVPDNIEGGVAEVRDSFIAVDAEYPAAHSENIYLCGGTANVQHSTLYNESGETSLIFGDGICGKGNTVTVENSLLAGGGYMLQPNSKGVSAPVRIVNNRVGRCVTAAHQDSGGGYVCASGKDANGFWPRGGQYGLDTELGSSAVWSGNVWDDNSQPMCPTEKAGCGSVTPPVETPPVETPPAETPVETPPAETPTKTPPAEPPAETPTKTPPTTGGGGKSEPEGGNKAPTKPTKPGSGTKPAVAESAAVSTPRASAAAGTTADVVDSTPGVASGGAGGPAKAIFHSPNARVGGHVILDGTDSTAIGHVTCTWIVEEGSGRKARKVKKKGCQVDYRFHRAGTAHVTLVVRGSVGRPSRLSRTLVVGSGQSGQLRVSKAARAF
jgi:hypothetical protein